MQDNIFNTSRGPAYDQEVDNKENSTIPSTIVIVNCFLNFPLMLISIFGNSLVLAAVIKTPSLRSPSIILLCGLAASDLVVGLIVQPLFIAKELKPFHFLRQLTKILSVTFCGISFATMSAISLDRFLALRYHMTYNSLNTTSRAKFTLIAIWLVNSLLFSGVHIWYKPEHFYISYGLVGVYIIISTIAYVCIFRITRRHQYEIRAQHQTTEVQNTCIQITLNVLVLTRTAVNTFCFYVCTVFCYLPWIIYRLSYNDISFKNARRGWGFAVTLVFANSAINPVLYCWRLRELRLAVSKLLRKVQWLIRKGEISTGLKGNDIKILRVLNSFRRVF